jgi:hypothetical protein
MALSRKPPTQSSVLSENQIDELINKGGGLPDKPLTTIVNQTARKETKAAKPPEKRGRKKKAVEEPKIPTQLRLSQEMLDEIDQLLNQRRLKTSRHSWFLEAIFEKIEKEKR